MFKDLLETLKINKELSEEHFQLLEKQTLKVNDEEFSKSVRVFPKKHAVNEHNCQYLKKLHKPIFRIKAEDTKPNKYQSKSFYGLQKDLYLCEGCRVMINCNLFTNLHIINGVTGFVVAIIFDDESS